MVYCSIYLCTFLSFHLSFSQHPPSKSYLQPSNLYSLCMCVQLDNSYITSNLQTSCETTKVSNYTRVTQPSKFKLPCNVLTSILFIVMKQKYEWFVIAELCCNLNRMWCSCSLTGRAWCWQCQGRGFSSHILAQPVPQIHCFDNII